jgi:hypothetical protein
VTLRRLPFLLTVGAMALALAASAAGTTASGAKTRHFNAPVGALPWAKVAAAVG